MPTNIYVHGLQQVASGILITAMMADSLGAVGDVGSSPGCKAGLSCDLMESLWDPGLQMSPS